MTIQELRQAIIYDVVVIDKDLRRYVCGDFLKGFAKTCIDSYGHMDTISLMHFSRNLFMSIS